jgi:hypothetical protein
MAKTSGIIELERLAHGLAAVAVYLEANEAAARCSAAAKILTRAINAPNNGADALVSLGRGLTALAPHLEPRDAPACELVAADTFVGAMSKTPAELVMKGTVEFAGLLVRVDRPELCRRSAALSATLGQLNGGDPVVAVLPHLRTLAEPLPCRFSTQDVVDLLKQPTCVGAARRLLLDQLQNRYDRKFADQWQFVHFAKEQGLALDFTSPPRRFTGGSHFLSGGFKD